MRAIIIPENAHVKDLGQNKLEVGTAKTINWIESKTPEWDYAWAELAKHEWNADNENPCICDNGYDAWVYMGTADYSGVISHCFRHRGHPKFNNTRCYLEIIASADFVNSLNNHS